MEIPRKKLRLDGADYGRYGYYFITITTYKRQRLFGNISVNPNKWFNESGEYQYSYVIDNDDNILTPVGATPCGSPRVLQMIEYWIHRIPTKFVNTYIDYYVIMPDHIHLILFLIYEGHVISFLASLAYCLRITKYRLIKRISIMSILGKIGKVASSNMAKEIVKIASSKISSQSTEKINSQDQTNNYCNYIKHNISRVCKKLSDLKNETQKSINEISSMKTSQLILKKMKGDYNTIKEQKDIKLKYLYLSRDFFNILAKYQIGVALNDEEKMLIIRFSPYFDDIPVLEDEKDNSILGDLIEIKEELKSEFISSKKDKGNFTLKDYVNRYNKQIEENIIPDIESAIDNFNNSSLTQKISSNNSTSNKNSVNIECTNCHSKLDANAKFCPECGSKVIIKRPLFCSQCGEPVSEEKNFCSNCGTKF